MRRAAHVVLLFFFAGVWVPVLLVGATIRPTPRERTALQALHQLVLLEFDGDVLSAFADADKNKDGTTYEMQDGGQRVRVIIVFILLLAANSYILF